MDATCVDKILVETLITCVDELVLYYCELEDLVNAEHAALLSREIGSVGKMIKRKEKLHRGIEASTEKLKVVLSSSGLEVSSLRDFVTNARAGDELGASRALDRLKDCCERLWSVLELAEEHIERNKAVISLMLRNYRESVLFWSEVVQARVASYDERGRSQNSKIPLQLNVGT